MYKSPISITERLLDEYAKMVIERRDNEILAKVKSVVDVDVDKAELLRALQYDRDQYEKGYADGKRDAMESIVRCEDCRYFYRDDEFNRAWCGYDKCVSNEVAVNGYCYRGERKDNG